MKPVHVSLSAALVAGLLGLAACGGAASTASAPQKLVFDLNVVGNGLKPAVATLTAHSGDTVTLDVSADRSEEIHLHGYDFHLYPKPGSPATKTFTANREGQFEIEIEASSTHLTNLDVLPR